MSYNHAKRHTISKKNTQRENLEISWSATKTWSFSGPPTYSKSKYTWKAILVPSALHRKVYHLSLTALHLTWWRPLENKLDITALGPNSYLWLKNTAKIHILIHTPCARKLDCKQEKEIQEIQYNRYVQQYRYNTDAIWRNTRNTIQWIHAAIQIQYGCHMENYKVQPCSLVNSTILGGKCKDQPSNFTALDSSSVRSMLGDSQLVAKQLWPDFYNMQMSYDTEKWPIVSEQLTIWPLKSIKVNKSSF